jgi:rhodanese-related sulfurtransferase
MDEDRFSISADDLYRRLGSVAAPVVVDVRRAPAYDADDRVIVGAVCCAPDEVAEWAHDHADRRPVVIYCVDGHEVSQQGAETLRGAGIDARYLAGGIGAWVERVLPPCFSIAEKGYRGSLSDRALRLSPKCKDPLGSSEPHGSPRSSSSAGRTGEFSYVCGRLRILTAGPLRVFALIIDGIRQ